MTKTRAELIAEALSTLGIGSVAQPASADDVASVEAKLEPFVAQLYAEHGVYVQDLEAIDDGWFLPLAKLLANELLDTFSIGIDEASRVSTLATSALFSLKVIAADRPPTEILGTPDVRFRRRRWMW